MSAGSVVEFVQEMKNRGKVDGESVMEERKNK
jgi:hypothetical protein